MNRAKKDPKPKPCVGALITFPPGTNPEFVKRRLQLAFKTDSINSLTVETYEAEFGSPVWYIP